MNGYLAPLFEATKATLRVSLAGTHHGRNEIVGDRKRSGIRPIMSHQQPPRETLLYIVQPIARRGLCDLHSLIVHRFKEVA